MSRLITFLSFSILATSVLADGLASDPTYLGMRSTNPEQETYGAPIYYRTIAKRLAFIGPARRIGPTTGDPEKDTVGYTPMLVESDTMQGSFNTASDQCENCNVGRNDPER